MITLTHLNKIYTSQSGHHHALKNINLRVEPGEIVCVIGKSGAGKSTLIRCVNLLERPTSGSVEVNGVELTTLNPPQLRQARHQIGMVFQHFNLLETRTVYQNIAFPLQLLKKSTAEIALTVMPLLEKVGLSAHKEAYPCELSGGQKQRVAIARALATQPAVLLCDEMTSSLDPETTDDILQLIRDINQEMRLSILCITHEMHVVKSIADRVAVIEHGTIAECESVISLFKNPKTLIAKKFVQSVFQSELPQELQTQLHFEPMPDDLMILRLTFFGHATVEPILSEFMQQTHVNVSILQANIEYLHAQMLGRMIVALDINLEKTEKVMAFLKKDGLTVEVMGYVDRQIWAH